MPLYARPARNQQKIRRQQRDKQQEEGAAQEQQQQQSADDINTNINVPANLKRKVDAKRPTLGHVVPAATVVRGVGGGSANPRLRPQGKAREAGLNNPSMLKILGGTARGRRLDSPQVYLRPMMGKVREALYSTLQSFEVYSAANAPLLRHLDLFAGSGSVGLESLSRGASHCTFCDLSQDCCGAIQRNIQWCQFGGGGGDNNNNNNDRIGEEMSTSASTTTTTKVVCGDVLNLLRQQTSVGLPADEKPYQVITICPPYEEVVYADLLDAVAGSALVEDDTIVVIEYPVELWGDLPHVYAGTATTMVGIRNRKYGRTVIAIYICNPTGRIENAFSRPEEFI